MEHNACLTCPSWAGLPKACLTKAERSVKSVASSYAEAKKSNLLQEVYITTADTQRSDSHTNMTRGHCLRQWMVFIAHVIDTV